MLTYRYEDESFSLSIKPVMLVTFATIMLVSSLINSSSFSNTPLSYISLSSHLPTYSLSKCLYLSTLSSFLLRPSRLQPRLLSPYHCYDDTHVTRMFRDRRIAALHDGYHSVTGFQDGIVASQVQPIV